MKRIFFLVVIALIVLQAVALLLIWGNPAQQLERSYTPTPQPMLPSATPTLARTPIPTLIQATLPAP